MNKGDDINGKMNTSSDINREVNISGDTDCKCHHYETFPEIAASVLVSKIVPPILLLLGTVGNILAIFVLRRPDIRKSVCSIYLVALALSDLIVLYSGLLRQWIYKMFDTYIRNIGNFSCKMHTFIVYSSLQLSSWILVTVTAERVLLVWFPRTTRVKCSRKLAFICISAIVLGLILFNVHILYGWGILTVDTSTTTEICVINYVKYKTFFFTVWPYLDFFVFCGLPLCFLSVGNVLIFIKVFLSRRKLARHVSISSETRRQSFSSMNIMLITVNTVFLLCNTPCGIFLIKYPNWRNNAHGHEYANMELTWAIVNILMYTNNACNFLFYVISGRRFRTEIKRMFKRKTHIAAAIIPFNKQLAEQIFLCDKTEVVNITSTTALERAANKYYSENNCFTVAAESQKIRCCGVEGSLSDTVLFSGKYSCEDKLENPFTYDEIPSENCCGVDSFNLNTKLQSGKYNSLDRSSTIATCPPMICINEETKRRRPSLGYSDTVISLTVTVRPTENCSNRESESVI